MSTFLTLTVVSTLSLVSTAGPEVRFASHVEARGATATVLRVAYDRLNQPPLDELEFVRSDVSFEYARRFTNYSGDVSGRTLGALQAGDAVLGTHAKMIDALLESFAKYQKPDGHFGADQNLDAEINQQRDMPILWGNGRLLWALAQACEQNPRPEVLAMARKLGDYVISTRPYYGKEENFKTVGGLYSSGFTTCYPSLVDGLALLGKVSGDKRFYEEARFIARLSLIDADLEDRHSHGRLSTYRGMLDLDRFTGQAEFLDTVIANVGKISETCMFPTGGIPELFGRNRPRDEGCSEADWLWVNLLLWRATGQTAYIDAAERVLRNHILATQCSNGGFGHRYFRTLHRGDEDYPAGGFKHTGAEAYWCCSMHCAQVLADIANYGILTQGENVLVTWLAEVASDVSLNGQSLRLVTEQNSPTAWKVTVSSPTPTKVSLRLRVPGWAKSIAVDRQRREPQDGWVAITLDVTGSQTLSVTMPEDIRLAGIYTSERAAGQPARVLAGPEMYCLPDAVIQPGLIKDCAVPHVLLTTDRPSPQGIPVILVGSEGRQQQATLVPLAKRPAGGCRYLFEIEKINSATFAAARASAEAPARPGQGLEILFSCDGQGELFLNGDKITSLRGYGEASRFEVYTGQRSNVVAIKAHSSSAHSGIIGVVWTGSGRIPTKPTNWLAAPWSRAAFDEVLNNPAARPNGTVLLTNCGGWRSGKRNPLPAQFAGTGARWLWPDLASSKSVKEWLIWCRFDLQP